MRHRVVWKVTLDLTGGAQVTQVPRTAKPLDVQLQHGAVSVWFEVAEESPMGPRVFQLFGTGDRSIPADGHYLGTVMLDDDNLVLHAYQLRGIPAREAR